MVTVKVLKPKQKRVEKSKSRPCPLCKADVGQILFVVNDFSVIRCSKCQMVFVDASLKQVDEVNTYPSDRLIHYYQNEPLATLAYYDLLLRKIQKYYNKSSVSLLDFGCGAGMLLRRARKLGFNCFGLDYSPYSKMANELFNLNIETNDVEKSNFKTCQFDVILSQATFEHLYDPVETARKLLTYLRPGGLFIISGIPNFQSPTIQLFSNFDNNHPPHHINYFEIRTLKALFDQLGLKTYKNFSYGLDFWSLLRFFKGVFYNSEGKMELNALESERYNYDQLELNPLYYMLANGYMSLAPPGKGICLCGWGLKEL